MSERHTLEVPRTACYHAWGASPADTLWFLLHGYGQRSEPFLASLAALERPGRRLLAPEALSRFYLRRGTGEIGASWMTRAERADEIRDTQRYLDLLWMRETASGAHAGELVALGFSQGGAAAMRWAVQGEAPITRLVSWGCPLPPDLELEGHLPRARRLRWSFVLGDADSAIDREAWEAGLTRLRGHGIEPEVMRFSGGHELEDGILARLEG